MPLQLTPQLKVGFFVILVLVILAYVTIRVSKTSLTPGGSYPVYLQVNSATGINKKTPVLIAGIQIGWVANIELVENNRAQLKLLIKKGIKVSTNVVAQIKTVGFLGDTYIELYQPGPMEAVLEKNTVIRSSENFGDLNSVTGQIGSIAGDIKAITSTLKEMMAGSDSSFARSLKNIERITESLDHVTTQNEGNLDAIVSNLKALSENLNLIVARNAANIDATFDNVEVITDKVRRGEGTLGKLVNDEATVEKINDSLDSLNDLLGGTNKLKVDLGYHAEYLGETGEFKNYVSLSVKPRPDKFFLFEFVDDPRPDSRREQKVSEITSGGVTTTVTEEIEKTVYDSFLFSAQIAKKYYGFTFRGGLIESSGGVGVDYDYGPLGVKLSAFDLETKDGERPHLKAMGTLNVTKSVYVLGGIDDFISQEQDPDWFFGAGITLTDDDLKSLVGLMSLKP